VEHWQCDEGEFDTKEGAIEAGIKYYTELDGYYDDAGEFFEGESFDVGLISNVNISLSAAGAIEQASEQAYEQSGDFADSWIEKTSKEENKMLSNMLTDAFWEWTKITSNEPKFFTMENVEAVPLPDLIR
jgi:hypothetical protein